MFLDFVKKETDALNPEGLDLLILKNNGKKLILNPSYLHTQKKRYMLNNLNIEN